MNIVKEWFKRYFTNPQVIILAVILLIGVLVILTLGKVLTPVLASVVIAFLLDGVIGKLERFRMPRMAVVLVAFSTFMAFLFFLLFGLMPVLSNQVGQMVAEFPSMIARGQKQLMLLPERYPEFISQENIMSLNRILQTELGNLGQKLLAFSMASVRGVVLFVVYLILVPFTVFFLLKDKGLILKWFAGFLPEDRDLSSQVYHDVIRQIGNYVRGKFLEILIVWLVTYIIFTILGLRFSILISLVVGLSVLVPYIGAAVVAFPVALVSFYQWGWEPEMLKIMIAYAVIQLLDGNLLAPLLLSEVVDIHPVAMIVSILVFGGLWGFWGVFFAIPLATLIQAILKAWPVAKKVHPVNKHASE
jgi:putative permease